MLLVTSTAQAAIGHAKHGSNSCRVGRGQRVLSMFNVVGAGVGQPKNALQHFHPEQSEPTVDARRG